MNGNTKIRITKKQAKELVEQLETDTNFVPYKSQTDFYYSFLHKKGTINIAIYKFDKKYYLQIDSLS
ncbi:hypothetical protein [Sulfolobus islandicus rod-shaped virus 4]|uniref:Uncharacterized protein n=1 Tax=Sulfolobus islandicus rod-shaped virus 4 TaxID=1983547 RepID=A0A1X9SJV8_9VIRU|nr:hypothetical protein CCL46_gp02 [Sulfolobus islandicus rod-shaped virus 4]ARQ96518.1 hypothetical protein [Sulfolobus islandicus rod-shaped virus 4]